MRSIQATLRRRRFFTAGGPNTSVLLGAGFYTLTGQDLALSISAAATNVGLNAGSYTLTGQTLTVNTGNTVSDLTFTPTSSTTAFVSLTVSPTGGDLHIYVSTSATPPSLADWRDGTGADFQISKPGVTSTSQINGPSGLTASTLYYCHVLYEDSGGGNGDTSTVSDTMPATDVIAPSMTMNAPLVLGDSDARMSVTTNEASGNVKWVVTDNITDPSTPEIDLGQDHVGSAAEATGTLAVSAVGTITADATGLTSGATRYFHAYHRDAAGNPDTVKTSSSFVPTDVTAPILTSGSVSLTTPDDDRVVFDFSSNDNNTGSDVSPVLATSATPPSAAQIIAGSGGNIVAAFPAFTPSVTGPQSVTIIDTTHGVVASGTEHWGYAVQVDADANESNVLASSNSVTTGGAPANNVALDAGSYTLTGQTLGVVVDAAVTSSLDAGSYTLTGQTLTVNTGAAPFFQDWHDGIHDGNVSNVTVADSQTDPDGGSNAITASNTGGGGASVLTFIGSFGNPVNVVPYTTVRGNVHLDALAHPSNMYARIEMANIDEVGESWVHIDVTGETEDTSGANVSNVTITPNGSGIDIQWDWDVSAETDTAGKVQISMSDAADGRNIDNSGSAGSHQLLIYNIRYTDIS